MTAIKLRIGLVVLICISLTALIDSKCWCNSLGEKVTTATNLLLKRYRRSYLMATSTVWSSGSTKALIRRIYNSLETKTPFRMGLVGGSFSTPFGHEDENTWVANVTRWINVMLSVSECSINELSLVNSTATCIGKPILKTCFNTTFLSHPKHEKPLFCQPFESGYESTKYHQLNRPIHFVCGHNNNDSRYCPIYIGSGKYAQISSAAKGNTQTRYSYKHLNIMLNPAENLDFLFWDHSANDDEYGADDFLIFMLRFIDEVHNRLHNLVGLGLVYWTNTKYQKEEHKSCYGSFGNISNSVAELHYPFLIKSFHPWQGRFRNISLLTMSQPLFCRVAGCNSQDFLDPNYAHPTNMGSSRFADLVIWHFLRIFKSIYKIYCVPSTSSSTDTSNHKSNILDSSQISWVLYSNETTINETAFFNEVEHLKNRHSLQESFKQVNKFLSYPIDPSYDIPSFHPEFPIQTNITVIATMPLHTPILGNPLPVDQLAILCAPGFPVNFDGRWHIAHESIERNISGPLHWVNMDIATVFQEKCAGWAEYSYHNHENIFRAGIEHSYEPIDNASCRRCPAPDWAGSDYPHGYWEQMPMVKKVDIVIRLSANLSWTHICLNPFLPRFLKQISDGRWREHPHVIDKNHQLTDYVWKRLFCLRKIFNPIADYYYLWYAADRHLRTQPKGGNEGDWSAPIYRREFGFINLT